ncbi:MAG TPA: ATP-binding protein [Gemmatimonadaceae bacterium]
MTARRLSIRSRLTLWYACSILLLFVGAAVVFRAGIRRTLLAEFDDDALDSSTLVRHFFHVESAEYRTIDQAVTDLVAEVVFPDRAIQIIRPDGSMSVPGANIPDTVNRRRATTPAFVRPPVRTLTVPLDTERARGWSIRIVSSAADLEQKLRTVDRWFAVGGLFIALLAAAVGWTLAGRLLQPVDAMARVAERTTAADPAARLPVQNPHDELGRLGRSFNGLLERLDNALTQQRRFLADAAHELRTPIARMSSLAEFTLSSGQTAAGATESLTLIADDLRHASKLLDGLLQLARADAGERMQRAERVFLDDIAMDAVAAWLPAAARTGVTLELADMEEAPIRVDPLLARRLVDTLLENAVRYTPAGGRIETSVRRNADRVLLTVSDTGIGIPSDDLPRIFERFFRGTSSRGLAPEGSGLGLPIAAWIVDQCRGTIEVGNGAGSGTSAKVSLPADRLYVKPANS